MNREFAKDIGLDTLQKKRFIKAITALKQPVYFKQNDVQNGHSKELTTLIENLQGAFKTVDDSIALCKQNTNNKINELIDQLKTMQSKILKDIDENGQNQKNKIGKELQMMVDARMGAGKLNNGKINEFKSMVALSTNYKIEFVHDQNAFNNLLSSMHIKALGLPQSVTLIVDPNKVTANSIRIEWKMNKESIVSQYEVQYAKWRKIGKAKTQKNKRKKKKKKKKSKKRKNKYDSSSDDSSESTSSQSSSSSDDSSSSSFSDELSNEDEKEQEQVENAEIDLKALKFKSVTFESSKKNSYKLKKLSRGYCYVIRLRRKNEFGWSGWSECVKVITKSCAKWQFQENEWLWKDFDASTSKKIQKALDRGKKKCEFDIPQIGQEYVINFRTMQQRNIKTGKVRKVRVGKR